MSEMVALRKVAAEPGGLSLDEISVPVPGPGEVCVEVAYAGICGTDLHIYNWVPFMRFARLPVVLGHELSGRVVELGSGVSRLKVGDRVAADSHIPCWQCYACLNEAPHVCQNTRYPGVHIDGAFARYVVLPQEILWVLDEDVDLVTGAMMEPFGIAVHAAAIGSGVSGQNVIISGCGPIGMMNLIVARAMGAANVIALDVNPGRLSQAMTMGADLAIDPSNTEAVEQVRELTRGAGADVVLEYSGAGTALELAGTLVAYGGEVRLLAVPESGTAPDFSKWILKGLTIRALHGRRLYSTWLLATRLLSEKKVDLAPVLSAILPLDEAETGFRDALAGTVLKVLVEPTT